METPFVMANKPTIGNVLALQPEKGYTVVNAQGNSKEEMEQMLSNTIHNVGTTGYLQMALLNAGVSFTAMTKSSLYLLGAITNLANRAWPTRAGITFEAGFLTAVDTFTSI